MTKIEIVCCNLDNSKCLEVLFREILGVPPICREVTINFKNVHWITPSGALALTLITHQLVQNGQVIILSEISTPLLAYLERIDYFQNFAGRVAISPFCRPFERLNRSATSHNLLEIWPIPCAEDANAQARALLLPKAEAVLTKSFAEKAKAIQKILTMISEIAGNISHCQEIGYCAIQTYDQHGRARIHIAIGDLGIGIRKSLLQSKALPFKNDLDYLTYALQEGTSSKQGARGLGLSGVYESLKELRGVYIIRSGTSSIMLQGGSRIELPNLDYVPGTQVEMIIRQ